MKELKFLLLQDGMHDAPRTSASMDRLAFSAQKNYEYDSRRGVLRRNGHR